MRPQFIRKMKWVSTDAWRGYQQPIYAIAEATDTGNWSDSPYPSHKAASGIQSFQKVLRRKGFHSMKMFGRTSNVFSGVRYLIVPPTEFPQAQSFAKKTLSRKKWYMSGVAFSG